MAETEKKRKRSDQYDPEPSANPNRKPPSPSSSSSSSRNWTDLPEPLLHSILLNFSSVADIISFAAVCRPFRLAAAGVLPHPRCPPLLLTPYLGNYRTSRFFKPTRASLQTLTLAPSSHPSPLLTKTLGLHCIGCSQGHLILIAGSRVVLADVFSGRETSSTYLPLETSGFSLALLTAPPSSPFSSLLIIAKTELSNDYFLLRWHVGATRQWTELQLTNLPEITSLIVFKQHIYGFDSLCRLISFELAPQMSFRLVGPQLRTQHLLYNLGKFGPHLVECSGELHAVVFASTGAICLPCMPKLEVYALDESRSEWVKKQGLGDWCLFIDAVGHCSYACKEPRKWGGMRNCVYVSGPGFQGFSVFPVNGCEIDTSDDSPLMSNYMRYGKWPSPVWVYPTLNP